MMPKGTIRLWVCLALALLESVLVRPALASVVRVGPLEFYGEHRVSQDNVFIGANAEVKEGETNHDVVVVLGDASIDGTVNGDLVVILGALKVGPKAHVKRGAVLVGGQLDLDPNADFHGFEGPKILLPSWLSIGARDWLKNGLLLGRPLPHHPGWSWWLAAFFLLLYIIIAILLPKPVQACVVSLEEKPVSSFFTGLLTFLLIGPFLLLLVASMVGVLVIPFLACAALGAFLIGKVAVCEFAGRQLGGQAGLRFLQFPLLALVLGTLMFYLLYMVPVIGFLVWGIVGTLALGAVTLTLFGALRTEAPGQEAAERSMVAVKARPGTTPASAGPPLDTTLLPRAGFWIRLAATALDLLLIGILLKIFKEHNPQRMFLAVWFLYHLLMWSWKHTTLGGIIFGLKIVRQNGEPLTFAVALVRCLSAFFSALVLLLGFFWAGWTRDKQSWHDIIADTTIVRYPMGTRVI
jgi:uncharacterized RDD family membrane protein YckC